MGMGECLGLFRVWGSEKAFLGRVGVFGEAKRPYTWCFVVYCIML